MRRNNVKSMVDRNAQNENDEGVSLETEDPHFPEIRDLTLNGDRALKTSWTLKKMDSDKAILSPSFDSPTKSCMISSLLSWQTQIPPKTKVRENSCWYSTRYVNYFGTLPQRFPSGTNLTLIFCLCTRHDRVNPVQLPRKGYF